MDDDGDMEKAKRDAEAILTEIMCRQNYGYAVRDALARRLVEIVRWCGGKYRRRR